ncbi:MAG TPA: hypothetical protein VF881_05725 [Polyangiaceae bacterium]
MALRSMIRWFVWASCLGALFLAARPAYAVAPMCDEKGASAIAPTPVLPIRDVKIDAGRPLPCDAPDALAPVGFRARGSSQVVQSSFDESWVPADHRGLPTLNADLLAAAVMVSLPPSAGYRRGVFRPPRG